MEDITDAMRMRTSAFFVADHAEAVNGKLYVVGGAWDTLYVSQLPTQHSHLSVAIVMHVPYQGADRSHRIEVRVVDQDGQEVVPPVQGQVEARRGTHMEPGDASTVVLVVNLVNLPIRALGSYRFDLLVDGTPVADTRVKIVQRPG